MMDKSAYVRAYKPEMTCHFSFELSNRLESLLIKVNNKSIK